MADNSRNICLAVCGGSTDTSEKTSTGTENSQQVERIQSIEEIQSTDTAQAAGNIATFTWPAISPEGLIFFK